MAIVLLSVNPEAVEIDDSAPDRDRSFIFEHLLHYCGKFDPLPAITISVDAARAVVVRGHKYLRAAKILRRPLIRAVVASPDSSSDGVARFISSSGATMLNWDEITRREAQELTPTLWHVFYFQRSLTREEKRTFETAVNELFSEQAGTAVNVWHDDEGPFAEFEAPTPMMDHAWALSSLSTFADFSRGHVPIVSYQGARFLKAAGS